MGQCGKVPTNAVNRLTKCFSPDGKKQKPPVGKKKSKGSTSDADHRYTTFPLRGKKRDKQKTLSQYNDLLKNFSIKRKWVYNSTETNFSVVCNKN